MGLVEFLEKLIRPEVVWVVIPVIAIVMGIGKSMLNRYFDHQERMARIEAGLDPEDEEDD